MDEHRAIPDSEQLRRWTQDEGLSISEGVERVFLETGVRVSPAALEADVPARPRPPRNTARYAAEIPWQVRIQHIKEYPARMLRILGRRREGLELTEAENQRLDAWLARLESDHAVIGYDPNSAFGFYYIEKDDRTDGHDGIPIRRALIKAFD